MVGSFVARRPSPAFRSNGTKTLLSTFLLGMLYTRNSYAFVLEQSLGLNVGARPIPPRERNDNSNKWVDGRTYQPGYSHNLDISSTQIQRFDSLSRNLVEKEPPSRMGTYSVDRRGQPPTVGL
ncbi:hypothetical protein FRC20_004965 [Serendipita sp. 405]|nr:hypothetical protein FRC16_004191 [Serendipita sp. 398]KAG8874851.1 hypothetical protein FRC20_004965 [Serendipita sp. 405]